MFFKQVAIIQKEARYEEAEKEYVATEEEYSHDLLEKYKNGIRQVSC